MKNIILIVLLFILCCTSAVYARDLFDPFSSGHDIPLILLDKDLIFYKTYFNAKKEKQTFLIYNTKTRLFEKVHNNKLPEDIYCLAINIDFVYLGGTGLSAYNKVTKRIDKWSEFDGYFIRAMIFSGGSLWLGTNNGLIQINVNTREIIKEYHQEDGLKDNSIYSLFADKHYLFIGCGRYRNSYRSDYYGKGISILDLEKGRIDTVTPLIDEKEWDEKDLLMNIYPIEGKANWYRVACWGYWHMIIFDYNILNKETITNSNKYCFIDGYINIGNSDQFSNIAKNLIYFIIDSSDKFIYYGLVGSEAANMLLTRKKPEELNEILTDIDTIYFNKLVYAHLKSADEETKTIIHRVLLKSLKNNNDDILYASAIGLAMLSDSKAINLLLKRAYQTDSINTFIECFEYINLFDKTTIDNEINEFKANPITSFKAEDKIFISNQNFLSHNDKLFQKLPEGKILAETKAK